MIIPNPKLARTSRARVENSLPMSFPSAPRQNDELSLEALHLSENYQIGIDQLSARERSVLALSIRGYTDEQIAQQLSISAATVNSYWARIRGKIGQHSRIELVSIVLRHRAQQELGVLKANIRQLSDELRISRKASRMDADPPDSEGSGNSQRSSVARQRMEPYMNEVEGKRILISGGTTGIGRATAQLLAERGARVYIFGRNENSVTRTVETIKAEGGDIEGSTADVGDRAEMERLFARVDDHFGGIDVLVNNASLPANNILNMEPDEWERVIRVNVLGYMLCSRWAVRHMERQGSGHIVGIGSLCIDVRDNGADVYVATKTAVHGFLESLRKEVVDMGIKVTIINPGGTASNMVTETPKEQETMIEEGRLLRPEDVAPAVLFALAQPPQVDVTELTIRPHRQSLL